MIRYKTLQRLVDAQTTGWNKVSDTWTYASPTTITVPAGATSLYERGKHIRLTQSGVEAEYMIYVVADTLLTIYPITGNTGIANSAISNIKYNHTKPFRIGCLLSQSSGQAINNATYTILNWTTEVYDYGGLHSVVTDTGRITIPITGIYDVYSTCSIPVATEFDADLYLRVTGTVNYTYTFPLNTTRRAGVAFSGAKLLYKDDYIQSVYYHNVGSTQTTVAGYTSFGCHLLSIV